MPRKRNVKKTKIELEKEVKKTELQLLKEKAKNTSHKFKNEFKKAISTAFMAAFGFIIALSWREVIQEYVTLLTQVSPIQGKLISAIIITFFSVIGIILVTSFLHQEQ